jgi:Na+/melibiose symporter-like transporter
MRAIAYAAPVAGGYFFYIPMWSILPGIYAKYFGLSLTSIAAVVLFIRLFDGVIDTTIGYLSDLHRTAGGSRKPWVIVGSLGTIVSCYFLFQPPQPTTTAYYLAWSMAYFLVFTIAEIPHLTWGSELTLDYQQRAQVFGVRYMVSRLGIIAFYALPLLPMYATTDYTPEVLQDAVYIGAFLTAVGLVWAILAAPAGIAAKTVREDSWRLFIQSLISNRPLLLYLAAFGCLGIAGGMWYGLIFFYLDSYLGVGGKVAMMFFLATVIAALSTPLWLKLIHKTSKSTVWVVGVLLFAVQLIASLLISPGAAWWIPFLLIIVANLFFSCHDVAALSILGDIVDYGKLKFHKDRGATYFGFNTLIFKVGLGVGGGLSLGIAGLFGFDPASAVHSGASILGLKLGFVVLPLVFALVGVVFILRTPIDQRRHRIIQRRIESRLVRSGT